MYFLHGSFALVILLLSSAVLAGDDLYPLLALQLTQENTRCMRGEGESELPEFQLSLLDSLLVPSIENHQHNVFLLSVEGGSHYPSAGVDTEEELTDDCFSALNRQEWRIEITDFRTIVEDGETLTANNQRLVLTLPSADQFEQGWHSYHSVLADCCSMRFALNGFVRLVEYPVKQGMARYFKLQLVTPDEQRAGATLRWLDSQVR